MFLAELTARRRTRDRDPDPDLNASIDQAALKSLLHLDYEEWSSDIEPKHVRQSLAALGRMTGLPILETVKESDKAAVLAEIRSEKASQGDGDDDGSTPADSAGSSKMSSELGTGIEGLSLKDKDKEDRDEQDSGPSPGPSKGKVPQVPKLDLPDIGSKRRFKEGWVPSASLNSSIPRTQSHATQSSAGLGPAQPHKGRELGLTTSQHHGNARYGFGSSSSRNTLGGYHYQSDAHLKDSQIEKHKMREVLHFWGICTDPDNDTIYLSERTSNCISKYHATSGKKITAFGHTRLKNPTALAFHKLSRLIFVCDTGNNRICKFDSGGTFVDMFGIPGQFESPWGISLSPDGNLLAVVDSTNDRIRLYSSSSTPGSGTTIRQFDMYGRGGGQNSKKGEVIFNDSSLRGFSFDHTGTKLYITSLSCSKIMVLDISFNSTSPRLFFASIPSELVNFQGFSLDEAGNLMICDTGLSCVSVVDPSGTFIEHVSAAGSGGYGNEPLTFPYNVCDLGRGRLVALERAGQIRIITFQTKKNKQGDAPAASK